MAGRKLQAPRGTFDVLGDAARRRRGLLYEGTAGLARAGYEYVETPIFEDTELFARGVGETTDVVQKEMFTFEDAGGRSVTLRPEGTASVCRAYIEHGLHKSPQPVKVWYAGPFFRYEAPQAGRFRQFAQIGAEALGSDDPSLDAESILLLADILSAYEMPRLRLRLSSLGTPETRRAYSEELRQYLRARVEELSDDVRARFEANPLRAFDSDHPGTRAVMAGAPKLLDRIAPEDAEHFAEVRALLDDAGQAYEVDPGLVRGLDYYTRTVFEFTNDDLGAQSGVGGGGRYDGLVEQLGGPPTPGVGWAAGVERILLAADVPEYDPEDEDSRRAVEEWERDLPPEPVFVALEPGANRRTAFALLRELHALPRCAQMEQSGRSLKGQMRHADRLGAQAVVTVSAEGFRVRNMRSGEETEVGTREEAFARLEPWKMLYRDAP
ncbi:MAG: histidine--tRNA ligase [Thermoleophilaceae bacterium]